MEAQALPSTHRIKVFADGTVWKTQCVTLGDLGGSAGGTAATDPYTIDDFAEVREEQPVASPS